MVKWTRGLALHITVAKDNWRFPKLSGLLIMKRKKGNQWAYYIAVKIDGKGKRFKHYYLTSVATDLRHYFMDSPTDLLQKYAIEDLNNAGFKILERHPTPRKPPESRSKLKTKIKRFLKKLRVQ